VESANKSASLLLKSGLAGNSSLELQSPTSGTSSFSLRNGDHSAYQILNDGEDGKFKIKSESKDMLSIDTMASLVTVNSKLSTTGAAHLSEGISIFGGQKSATASLTSDQLAYVDIYSSQEAEVKITGQTQALLNISVAQAQQPMIHLQRGSSNVRLSNNPTDDTFTIDDGSLALLRIHRQTGNMQVAGNVSISGSGDKHLLVQSTDKDATVELKAGSTGTSNMLLSAGASQNATLQFRNPGGVNFHMTSSGKEKKFVVGNSNSDLLWFDSQSKIGIAGSLDVHGTTSIDGHLKLGSLQSPSRTLNIVAGNGESKLVVKSGSSTPSSSSIVKLEAHTGRNATVHLGTTTGAQLFLTQEEKKFSINNGAQAFLTIDSGTGNTDISGNVAIGSDSSPSRTLHLISGGSSELQVEGRHGAASVTIESQSGHSAAVSLNSFHMVNHGSSDKFSITDGVEDLFELSSGTGDATLKGGLHIGKHLFSAGNMQIGGTDAAGARDLTIASSDGAAAVVVKSNAAASSVQITAGSNSDASVRLGDSVGYANSIVHEATTGSLLFKSTSRPTAGMLFTDSTLMSLNKDTGLKLHVGNLTIGDQASQGSRSLTIASSDSTAELNLLATAVSSESRLTVASGRNGNATIHLGPEQSGFTMASRGSSQTFAVSSPDKDLLTISSTETTLTGQMSITESLVAGNVKVDGDLTVGGLLKRPCANSEGTTSARWLGNNHCYMLMQASKYTFSQAQQQCELMDGYLATIKSPAEHTFVKSQLQPHAKSDFYIGYVKVANHESFQWINGEIAVYNNTHLYTNWESPEAVGKDTSQCAVMYTTLEDVGFTAVGTVSQTISGKTCRKWSDTTPHGYIFNPAQFSDGGLGNHNYCRNPDKRPSGPFCVTTDPAVTTESCDVTGVWRGISCSESKAYLCERNW